MIKKFINGIIDFILPGACLHCEAPIDNIPGSASDKSMIPAESVKFICPKCYGKLEKFNSLHPWRAEQVQKGVIYHSMSAFWFREGGEIQTLMHEMKYGKMRSIGRLFGREIGRRVIENDGKMKWDCIVPVPLHKARFRDRTYNQSEFIARGVAEIIDAEFLANVITRVRYTGTQTKLNKKERKENIKDAFSVDPKYAKNIKDKNILLVDDVITTGATILECAGALRSAGAANIYVCSAAYAELKD